MSEADIIGNMLALRGAINDMDANPTSAKEVATEAAFNLIQGFLCNVARIADATQWTGQMTSDRQQRDIEWGRW